MAATSLIGKVAMITGASSGIGAATSLKLAGKGVKVALLARRFEKLQDLESKIKEKGGEALAIHCDITKKDQVFAAADKIRENLGKIDILVNNAGVSHATYMKNCELEGWEELVAVNVNGPLNCYAATLKDMIEKTSGHIVNISSVTGRMTYALKSVYCGTKHFMQGHSAGMRQELSSYGIKVTVIQPGPVLTEILDDLMQQADPDIKSFFEKNPLFYKFKTEPLLQPEDIAEAVAFALTQPDTVGVNEILIEPKTFIMNNV